MRKRSYSATKTRPAVPVADRTAAIHLSPHQWSDIVQYLTAEELKALRLAGSRDVPLADPSLTCHLQLRMDKAPFFSANDMFLVSQARKWLTNRQALVINDVAPKICPNRVAYLVGNGFLDSVSQIVIFDCHLHRVLFSLLSQLPNLESLRLASHASDQGKLLDDLEAMVANVGKMLRLKKLDIEFDCVIHGSRLSFLRKLHSLEHLRLRGFDLSDGITSMGGLIKLNYLHLCHGNFYSSPSNDVNEKDLLNLMALTNLKQVHLEGFDALSDIGLKAFSNKSASIQNLGLKHCQDLSEECLPSLGQMTHLTSLHFVNSAYDEVPIFDDECLHYLNALVKLESLSLFYVLEDLSDLRELWGLESLQTLNIAFDETMTIDAVQKLCQTISPIFGSLQKLRIFSEEGMNSSFRIGAIQVEFAPFTFGDLVYLG
mmetsp:Transcript_38810/g.66241  ORF Transcript_38810/g.66241 Transcript_38810/m.66241 type:complete len:430 (-) Transcript_38810:108-1397(-)|eukprot:CAMPEP_0183728286 /NCGR_PEP_ID=MMETSP0737-20130205/27655_1 /TAXON_ID=385413 /ORGANISM="Thalassiosira miniscula, Strain CCMP1093" /LENGTH=429 /DNA_ID=CAMNT_0025960179 /DNA_START=241 /DNA_END=1530 /DNA_ORIENTATION=+